jgi:acyl-CoA reductase-like NAD-dependent aldehyde dehydrogenase
MSKGTGDIKMSEAKSTTTENARTAEQGSNASIADFGRLVAHHRAYFQSGATRSVEWRESQLIALRSMMKDHAEDFYAALWTDLRRNRVEADWVDVKYMTSEIDHTLAHLRHWMKPVSASTPFALTPSHVQVRFDPLGVGLIIGTWNYPLMLLLSPLVAAIAAGNAAVIKPSEVSAATAEVNARPSPLGLYLFSEDESVTEEILNSRSSGDAGVNECTLQPIVHDLPFGGVGNSGMGKYHGEWGFRAYTNARGVLYHRTSLDFSALRYPTYDHNRRLREFVIPS